MNKTCLRSVVAILALVFLITSCKKNDDTIKKTPPFKKEWVTGKWKQKDLIISVQVKLGGTKIPAGTSMIALAPMLGQALGNPAIAQMILCTKNNEYTFNGQGAYDINGCTEFILPKAGNKGTWDLEVYDAVLALTSSSGEKNPHWINNITSTTMELGLTVNIPGVGDAPLGLILEKQP